MFSSRQRDLFGIMWAEAILTLRLWALWGRGRNIGIFIIIISAINATVGVVGFAFLGPFYTFTPMDSISPTIPGCFFSVGSTSFFWVSFAALAGHLTFIFTMMMIKGFQHYRTGMYGTSLVRTFYMDGIIYYLTLQVLSVINLIVILNLSRIGPAYINLLISIQRVFHSILSARILLHLRQEAEALCENVPNSAISMHVI
ncbi:hypothetical protein L208DRAFT_158829 [Tricholoma matsutake]|nr:hypothetical protein L208DRAFT_158829 [Tricholoma matsutake 945]